MPLSADQIDAWERDGYVIVRGLWTAAEIDACRDPSDGIAADPPTCRRTGSPTVAPATR